MRRAVLTAGELCQCNGEEPDGNRRLPPLPVGVAIWAEADNDAARHGPFRTRAGRGAEQQRVPVFNLWLGPGLRDRPHLRWLGRCPHPRYSAVMSLRAVVKDGRLVVDEPTTLPDGTVLDLVVDDEGDDLDATERATLHAHLESSWEAARRGELIPAEDVLAELREKS